MKGFIRLDEGDVALHQIAHDGAACGKGDGEVDGDVEVDQGAGGQAVGVFVGNGSDQGGAELPEVVFVRHGVVLEAEHQRDAKGP